MMFALPPEYFDLASLPYLPLSDKGKLPNCAAVYFALSSHGRVLYIGRSIDVRERFRGGHHRLPLLGALGGVKIAWLKESDSLALRRIETIMIKYFNPPLNRIPSYLKAEDTVNLINYLTLNEQNHKSNVISLNKYSIAYQSKTNELVNQIQAESKLHLPLEAGWKSQAEFKEVILEQAKSIKHLEEEMADLRLMFQEQIQVNRQLTEALVEQAEVISELSRTQAETNSRFAEVTVEQALTISNLSSALEKPRYENKAED